MADEHKEHQQRLAQSGYRLPDAFYTEDPNASQASTEQQSGDGGIAAGDTEQTSEHGYKGALLTQEEVQDEAKRASGTEVSYASAAAREAAEEAKLVPADFAGATPSSEKGFTAADVKKLADAKQS